jgi:hypothetical protein
MKWQDFTYSTLNVKQHMLSVSEFVISSYFIRDSDMETLLTTERSGVRIPAGVNFSHLQNFQTFTGAYASSYEIDSGGLSPGVYRPGHKVHLVPRLRTSGVLFLLLLYTFIALHWSSFIFCLLGSSAKKIGHG